MDISVSQGFIDDTELFTRTVKSFIGALNRIWAGVDDLASNEAEAKTAFLQLAKGMSIKYGT